MITHLRERESTRETFCGKPLNVDRSLLYPLDSEIVGVMGEVPRSGEAIKAATAELDAGRFADGRFVGVTERPCATAEFCSAPAIDEKLGRVPALCRACVRAKAELLAWPREPEREDEDGIRELARGIAEGRAYTSGNVTSARELASVFLTLSMADPPPADFLARVGCVWEWLDVSAKRVGARPMFFSARWLHVDDWPLVLSEVDRLKGAKT